MLLCFICKKNFINVKEIAEHLQRVEGIPSIYTFKCIQHNCNQIFQNIYKYKTHLQKHVNDERNSFPIENFNPDLNAVEQRNIESLYSPDELSYLHQNISNEITNTNEFEAPVPNIDRCIKDLERSIIEFSLNLHNTKSLPRNMVFFIQDSVKCNITSPICDYLLPLSAHTCVKSKIKFDEILNFLENPFKEINTEYKFFKYIETLDIFSKPKSYVINNELVEVFINGIPSLNNSQIEVCLLDISFQFKKFFESGDILELTLNNMKSLELNSKITNFINGSLWKQKKLQFEDKIVIPFHLYLDDFEVNDPLSSHAGKHSICGVYYSFPTIPKFQTSILNNIFVAAFIKSKDMKEYGINQSLRPLIDVIKTLETDGIEIKSGNSTMKVYFILGQILGDNLGLNQVLGYTTSFNSEFFCRLCKRTKIQTQTDITEQTEFLRNEQNYNNDVRMLNLDNGKTGIKTVSMFNELVTYHVTDNVASDIMHDVFLGVCKYNLQHILNYFIFEKKYFSLQNFNYKKQMFNYGEIEIRNLSEPIERNHIKYGNFKMTAREIWTFYNFFPLIIGTDVPRDDSVYKFLLLSVKLIDLLVKTCFDENDLAELTTLIEQHNNLFITIFKQALKPKYHFLVHYPTIIRRCGPLKFLWCFRFEAQHQLHKQYARNITSRLNIPLTLAIKASLKFTKLLFCNEFFQTEWETVSKLFLCPDKDQKYAELIPFSESDQKYTSALIFRGTNFKTGYFFGKPNNNKILIYEIIDILLTNNNFFAICKSYNNSVYIPHFHCHSIGDASEILSIIDFKDIESHPVNLCYLSTGEKVVRLKQYI